MSRVAELECAAALGSRDPKRHRAGSMIADAVRYVRAQRETAGLTQCVGQHDRKCSLSCAEAVDHPHFVEVLARGCPVASSVASWSIVGRSESAYSCWAPPHGSQRCRPSPRASFATPISLKGAWSSTPGGSCVPIRAKPHRNPRLPRHRHRRAYRINGQTGRRIHQPRIPDPRHIPQTPSSRAAQGNH
jgi:hypothetical protein